MFVTFNKVRFRLGLIFGNLPWSVIGWSGLAVVGEGTLALVVAHLRLAMVLRNS